MPHIESRPQSYRNPIIPGFNPDPSMIRVKDDYFLVTSSFEYFAGLPIYHSKDLINWRLINHACTRRSQLDLRTVEAGGGLFAPTIRERNGRIYVACCQMQKSDSLGGYKVSTCIVPCILDLTHCTSENGGASWVLRFDRRHFQAGQL